MVCLKNVLDFVVVLVSVLKNVYKVFENVLFEECVRCKKEFVLFFVSKQVKSYLP